MLVRTGRSSRRSRPRTIHGDGNVLLIDRRCAYYKRERTGRFQRFRVARLWQSRCSGTSVGRVLEVALSGPSPSVVVDDAAPFVYLEYGLELAVDDHVHGLRKRRRKVYLDAEITLSNQVEATAIFFFSMDIISPDLDSFRAAAVGVGV